MEGAATDRSGGRRARLAARSAPVAAPRRLSRPYRWQVAATLVALALAAAAVLVFGVGLRHLIDGGFAAGRSGASTMR